MKEIPSRIMIIGCPGSGKSTFARKLRDIVGYPLYYLDMIYHKPDRTTHTREEFDASLAEMLSGETWIIDGNYSRTVEARLECADAVIFFDLPTEVCVSGIEGRVGTVRADMPWVELEVDPEFRSYVERFKTETAPKLYEKLEGYKDRVKLTVFSSRAEADEFLSRLARDING